MPFLLVVIYVLSETASLPSQGKGNVVYPLSSSDPTSGIHWVGGGGGGWIDKTFTSYGGGRNLSKSFICFFPDE